MSPSGWDKEGINFDINWEEAAVGHASNVSLDFDVQSTICCNELFNFS